jgi:hypothetical protein
LLVALVAILVAGVNQGIYVQERFATGALRYAGQVVSDPEDPEAAMNFCLIWALYFGIGSALFQTAIWAAKRRREKRVARIERIVGGEIPAHHQWWGKGA